MNRQTENIIEIRNMCFRRGSRMLFNDISLDVPRGKVTAIMAVRDRENHTVTPDWRAAAPGQRRNLV